MKRKFFVIIMIVVTIFNTLCVNNLLYAKTFETSENTELSEDKTKLNNELINKQSKLIEDLSNNTSFFEYVKKEDFEKNNHIARIENLEKLNTYVFSNMDGSNTVYYLSENTKFISSTGNIVEKNIELEKNNEIYKTKQNDIQLEISKKSVDGVYICNFEGQNIKMTPKNCNECIALFSKEDNTIVYKNIFDDGVDLRYTPSFYGVKEDIIINKPIKNNLFEFTINTNMNIYENDCGLYFALEEKSTLFLISSVIIYDQAGHMYSTRMKYVKKNDVYMFSIAINENFLNQYDIAYPVIIDPSIIVQDKTHLNLIEDAAVYSGDANQNFGNSTVLKIGNYNAGSTNYGTGRVYVRLRGLLDDEIYQALAANEIKSAKYVCYTLYGGADFKLRPVNGNITWNENTINWNNASSFDQSVYWNAITNKSFDNSSVHSIIFDIKSIISAWKCNTFSNGEGGFCITRMKEETDYVSIYSSEYGNVNYRPYVELTYFGLLKNGTYYMKNKATNLMADATGYSNGSEILQYCSHGQSNQQWIFEYQNNGTYTIKNEMSGKYLGISEANNEYALTKQYSVISENTQWYIKKTSNNSYRLTCKANVTNTLALATRNASALSGTSINYIYPVTGSDYRDDWIIMPVDVTGIVDGETYYIKNFSNGKYLSIYNNNYSNGTNVIVTPKINNSYAGWKIIKKSEESYTFFCEMNTKDKAIYVDTNGNATIRTWNSGLEREMFLLERNEKGLFTIKYSDMYLSIDSINTTNVILAYNQSNMTEWTLEKVEKNDAKFYSMKINAEYDTSIYENDFINAFNNCGYNSETVRNSDAATIYQNINENDILIISGHGSPYAIQMCGLNGIEQGKIVLNESISSGSNVYSIDNLPLNALAHVSCVVLLACSTTYEIGTDNIAESFFEKGAHCVIGFNNNISSTQIDIWFSVFLDNVDSGEKINVCVQNANASIEQYTATIAKIIGDGNQYL